VLALQEEVAQEREAASTVEATRIKAVLAVRLLLRRLLRCGIAPPFTSRMWKTRLTWRR
jgi:hypothetical protein